jgi:hypothetical protein
LGPCVNSDQDADRLEQWADEQVGRWMQVDPKEGVGDRHHTVPRFYLRRFADSSRQLSVRNRETGASSIRHIKDLAITNFYTSVADNGDLEGRIEQGLAKMEDLAAGVFKDILSPYRTPRPLSRPQSEVVAQFMAFQLLRGPRKRREIELLADWWVKFMNQDKIPPPVLASGRAVPHPNEHLRILTTAPKQLARFLAERPAILITLDRPLLITCDEPVIVNVTDDNVGHRPECSITQRQIQIRMRKKKARRRGSVRQIVHHYPTRSQAVALAEEVGIPLSPRALLLLGPIGAEYQPSSVKLTGDEAESFAQDINARLVDNAYEWVAAHPDHETFADMTFPDPGPILLVCDGGTVMSEQMREAPTPRRPQRLRKDWPPVMGHSVVVREGAVKRVRLTSRSRPGRFGP